MRELLKTELEAVSGGMILPAGVYMIDYASMGGEIIVTGWGGSDMGGADFSNSSSNWSDGNIYYAERLSSALN